MSKKISQQCIDLIKEFEGCYLTSYQDPVGVWTIGYGTTSSDKSITGKDIVKGMTITKSTAEEWLEKSLNNKYLPLVTKYDSKYDWNQNELDALVSFCYNIGSIDQLTSNGTRSRSTIASKMLEYDHANGQVLPGLTSRRKAEQELFLTPVTSTSKTSSSVPDCTSERVEGVKYFNIVKNQNIKTLKTFLHNRGYGAGVPNKELIAKKNAKSSDMKSAMLELAKDGKLIKPTGLKKQDGTKFKTSETVYFTKATGSGKKSITTFLHNRGFGAGGPNLKKIARANCNTKAEKDAMLLLAKKGLLIKPTGLNKLKK